MKTILCMAVIMLLSKAHASTPLKQGIFYCEDSNYNVVTLKVSQHPTKVNKAMLNWEGRNRILHREESISGAVRYEGFGSKLLYIQTPHHSLLLDNSVMKVILSECIK
jgi:hypothetical protein